MKYILVKPYTYYTYGIGAIPHIIKQGEEIEGEKTQLGIRVRIADHSKDTLCNQANPVPDVDCTEFITIPMDYLEITPDKTINVKDSFTNNKYSFYSLIFLVIFTIMYVVIPANYKWQYVAVILIGLAIFLYLHKTNTLI